MANAAITTTFVRRFRSNSQLNHFMHCATLRGSWNPEDQLGSQHTSIPTAEDARRRLTETGDCDRPPAHCHCWQAGPRQAHHLHAIGFSEGPDQPARNTKRSAEVTPGLRVVCRAQYPQPPPLVSHNPQTTNNRRSFSPLCKALVHFSTCCGEGRGFSAEGRGPPSLLDLFPCLSPPLACTASPLEF